MTKNRDNKLVTWVEISKSSLSHNLNQFIKIAGRGVKTCLIIKPNAYGHDMAQAAKTLQNRPIWGFGVVNLAEALFLRKQGIKKPILVLSYVNDDLENGLKNAIRFSIYSLTFAKKLNRIAGRLRKKAIVHVKIDVGTSRLGLLPRQTDSFFNELKKLSHLKIEGLFSHLADSENKNWNFTLKQLEEFKKAVKRSETLGFNIPLKHIACSAAALGSKDTHFNLIRLGLSLYGLWPSEACRRRALKKYKWLSLKPVLAWQTKIIQVKILPKNSRIGYGGTYKTKKPVKLAVLPVGYYEGYDRCLSNNSEVLIGGKRCKVLGRVCMNMMMADVSKISKVKTGDRATLIGKQKNEEITADELAEKIGTINYEVVTRINPLIPRIYG